jgi:hypothetical protein
MEKMTKQEMLKIYPAPNVLLNRVKAAIEDVEDSPEILADEEGNVNYVIETISDSPNGIYMSGDVISTFDIPEEDVKEYEEDACMGVCYSPEVWDDVIEPFADRLSDALNEFVLEKYDSLTWDLSFYFGNHEGDGSYCLILRMEKK